MVLQSIFYALAIILMILMISVMVAFIFFLIKIQTSIRSMRETITTKAKQFTSSTNSEIMGIAGGLLTSFISSRVRKMFRKKKRSED